MILLEVAGPNHNFVDEQVHPMSPISTQVHQHLPPAWQIASGLGFKASAWPRAHTLGLDLHRKAANTSEVPNPNLEGLAEVIVPFVRG